MLPLAHLCRSHALAHLRLACAVSPRRSPRWLACLLLPLALLCWSPVLAHLCLGRAGRLRRCYWHVHGSSCGFAHLCSHPSCLGGCHFALCCSSPHRRFLHSLRPAEPLGLHTLAHLGCPGCFAAPVLPGVCLACCPCRSPRRPRRSSPCSGSVLSHRMCLQAGFSLDWLPFPCSGPLVALLPWVLSGFAPLLTLLVSLGAGWGWARGPCMVWFPTRCCCFRSLGCAASLPSPIVARLALLSVAPFLPAAQLAL